MPGLVTVTQSGGCGFWTGFGRIARSGIENDTPSQAKRSCVHIFGSTRTYSSQVFLVVSGSALKPPSSVQVDERAVPNSSRPPEMMSRTAARSATRTGWFISGTQTTAPWPTRMRRRLHGAGGQEDLGRRAVRVLLEEVVLDGPHGVEAELVGEPHLLEGVLVHDALDSGCERAGDGQLEEEAELHGRTATLASPERRGQGPVRKMP